MLANRSLFLSRVAYLPNVLELATILFLDRMFITIIVDSCGYSNPSEGVKTTVSGTSGYTNLFGKMLELLRGAVITDKSIKLP